MRSATVLTAIRDSALLELLRADAPPLGIYDIVCVESETVRTLSKGVRTIFVHRVVYIQEIFRSVYI